MHLKGNTELMGKGGCAAGLAFSSLITLLSLSALLICHLHSVLGTLLGTARGAVPPSDPYKHLLAVEPVAEEPEGTEGSETEQGFAVGARERAGT